MRSLLVIFFVALSLAGWAQRDRDKGKMPIEDLSTIRPQFTTPIDTTTVSGATSHNYAPIVQPVILVNQQVDMVLDSIDRMNVLRRSLPGYTIQIYSGQNREEAGNARKKLQELLDMRADLQYQQPKFRVRSGYYFTSLDAQKDLMRLRKVFPNAILVPEQVPVK